MDMSVHTCKDEREKKKKKKDERENMVNGKRVRYDLQSVGMLGFGGSLIAVNEGREFQ